MNNQKENQFISWLCGENVEFPFFKNFQEVRMPTMVIQGIREGRFIETPTGEIVEPEVNDDL